MYLKNKFHWKNLLQILTTFLILGTGVHFALFSWKYIFKERKIDQREVESRRFDIDQNLYEQNKKFLEELRGYRFSKSIEELGNPFLP